MKKRRFSVLFNAALVFAVILIVLFFERLGVLYGQQEENTNILDRDQIVHIKEAADVKKCLVIMDSRLIESTQALVEYNQVLIDMRVPFEVLDIADFRLEGLSGKLNEYSTLIILIDNMDLFGERVFDITRWVGKGGRALFGIPVQRTETFDLISGMLGINNHSFEYGNVAVFHSEDDFMLGAQKDYVITDPYESAMVVELDAGCNVHACTSDGDIPLVWSRDYKN